MRFSRSLDRKENHLDAFQYVMELAGNTVDQHRLLDSLLIFTLGKQRAKLLLTIEVASVSARPTLHTSSKLDCPFPSSKIGFCKCFWCRQSVSVCRIRQP